MDCRSLSAPLSCIWDGTLTTLTEKNLLYKGSKFFPEREPFKAQGAKIVASEM